jgi:hypothetical protein
VPGGVDAAGRGPRRRDRAGSLEERAEEGDRIGEVHLPVVVRVGGRLAGERAAAQEEPRQDGDRVGEVDLPVGLGVAAAEAGRGGRGDALQDDRSGGAEGQDVQGAVALTGSVGSIDGFASDAGSFMSGGSIGWWS